MVILNYNKVLVAKYAVNVYALLSLRSMDSKIPADVRF
jgi:hypothetical protein